MSEELYDGYNLSKRVKQLHEELTNCKAEIDRLKAEIASFSCHSCTKHCTVKDFAYLGRISADNARLKAENERLTKAGDAMASIIKYHPDANAFDAVPDVVKRWNAAKEGRDL